MKTRNLRSSIVFLFLFVFFQNTYGQSNVDIYKINININGKIPVGKMTKAVFDYEKGNRIRTIVGKIKRRGGFSMRFAKHSYEIDFKEDISLAGLPADDDWILNANYIDKTFLRHVISYELFEDMHKNNIASKCKFVELYLNKKYVGLYVLMEKLDKSSLNISGKDTSAFIFKEPHIFRTSYTNIRPQKEDNFHQQTYPKKIKKDQAKYVEELREFILTSSDASFKKEISERFDLTNLIDWNLLLLISNNSDGILKNFYLYKQSAEVPMRIAPWDYDHSFGRDGDNEMNLKNYLNVKRSILFKRLLQFDWYNKQLKARWKELNKKGILSFKGLKKRVLKKSKMIQRYAEKNFELWPVNAKTYYDANDFEQEIELMLNFIKERHIALNDYFDGI